MHILEHASSYGFWGKVLDELQTLLNSYGKVIIFLWYIKCKIKDIMIKENKVLGTSQSSIQDKKMMLFLHYLELIILLNNTIAMYVWISSEIYLNGS